MGHSITTLNDNQVKQVDGAIGISLTDITFRGNLSVIFSNNMHMEHGRVVSIFQSNTAYLRISSVMFPARGNGAAIHLRTGQMIFANDCESDFS